jgi:hypothetical protein
MHLTFRGIRPDDLHGRRALRNPERGFRTEMYFSTIPGEIAGMCSCHQKQLKLDGRPDYPIFQNIDVFSFTFENEYSQCTVIPVVATPHKNRVLH